MTNQETTADEIIALAKWLNEEYKPPEPENCQMCGMWVRPDEFGAFCHRCERRVWYLGVASEVQP